jgi:hypothetical protein
MLVAIATAMLIPVQSDAAVSAAQQFAQPCGNPGSPGQVHHVIWIWMENEAFSSVIGNAHAPYQTSLAHQCGLPTNFHNETHASLSNYIAATSGQNVLGTTFVNGCLPNDTTNFCVSSGPSIFSQLQSAGGTWRDYAEDMPTDCDQTNSGEYVAGHNPPVFYSTLSTCKQFDIPMGGAAAQTGAFYDDVRGGNLPSFSFITPNLIDDAHSSSTAVGDAWLSQLIPFITSSANYQNGDTTIFITNDKGAGADYAVNENCADPTLDLKQPSCLIPTIVVAPYVPTGTMDSTFYTHYSMLRTAEELLGLPLLGLAATANSMTTAFNLGPVITSGSTPPSAPTNLTATATSPTNVNLRWTASVAGSAPVATYQISRAGVVIGSVTGTSFSDPSVSPGTSYSYSVSAVDTNGVVGPPSGSVSVTTPGSANLLVNPGFESWTGGAPTGWAAYGPATTLTQSTDAHSGSSSVQIATTSAGYAASGIRDGSKPTISSTMSGVTYTATCWAKVSKAITVKIQLHEEKQNGVSVGTTAVSSLAITDSTWHQLQVSYTAVGSGNKVPLAIYSTNTKGGGPTFEVDDCTLTTS